MFSLSPLREFKFPVAASCISPDFFETKSVSEVEALVIWEGNRQKTLDELFKVQKVSDVEADITINGNVGELREIGAAMTKGSITIRGDAGMHLGKEMKAGKITVLGNAGTWTGSMMTGGEIEIHGDAGDFLAAPYWGTRRGMKGGKITVHGNAGNEVGSFMKDGVIKICGTAGQFAGFRMSGGTIYVRGSCGSRVGACMTDGRIIVAGEAGVMLPSFEIDGVRARVKIEDQETVEDDFYVFVGDIAEDGRGKVYVSKTKNPHLKQYERFLSR